MNKEIKLLMIDDEVSTDSTVRRLEIKHNIKVDWAKTPKEGLKLVKQNNYDALVIDIMMPADEETQKFEKINNEYGLETGIILLKIIKLDDKLFESLIIFFCSARENEITQNYDLIEGKDFLKYFRKPYNTANLYELIKENIK